MAFASFADTFSAYDSTSVENLFILEFMPYAPDDYVRAYLYGLMLCHHPTRDMSVESIARALNMEEKKLIEAFRYWEQKGLVVGASDNPPTFQYVSVRSAMLADVPADEDTYRYRDYNNTLQSIVGGLLHPKQFQSAMEWVEDFKIPPEVVLEMARFKADLAKRRNGGKPRTVPYLFKIFQATITEWAKNDIRTMDKAREALARELPSYQLASKILDYFNYHREPTNPELDLCDKWLFQWEYDEKTVLRSLKETTAGSNPSFAYVDGILSRHLADKDKGGYEAGKATFDAVKEVLATLGSGGRPTDDWLKKYDEWLDKGFEASVLLRAASSCNERNQHSLEQLDRLLQKWENVGLLTQEAVSEYIKKRQALRQQMNKVFEKAGISRNPVDAELDLMAQWLQTYDFDVILFAAECAFGTTLPLKYITKNLGDWQKAGVHDLAGAKAEREKFTRPAQPKREAKVNPALQYSQREIDDHEFDDFFEDLNKPTGGNNT